MAAVIVLIALGLGALHHLTRTMKFCDVRAALRAIGGLQMAAAIGLTAISYLALTFYDVLALRIIGRPLPWRTAALASFTSYTLSHNLGLALITGGSARYRVYTNAGLPGSDVARIVALAGAAFWMGVVVMGGLGLVTTQSPLTVGVWSVSPDNLRLIGTAMLLVLAIIVILGNERVKELHLLGWRLPLPSRRLFLAQIAVAAVDLSAASAALFVLVPHLDPSLLPSFVLAYSLALVATLVSHVPGGVGVFEAVVIAALPSSDASLFAALIVYRLIYYLLPLACAVTMLALNEGRRWRRSATRTLAGARSVADALVPVLMSAACFTGGAVLVLSGSLPGIHHRIRELTHFVPLPFVEASHVAASIAGTALLLLAPGLYRRLDGAFLMTRTLLIAGSVFSLIKGIDYEEAIICFAIAGLLQLTSPAFYRRTALTGQMLSRSWLVCVAAVVGISLWIGFFSNKHVTYQDSLWWQFTLKGDASRFLRASLGVGIVLAGGAVWRLLGPSSRLSPDVGIDEVDLERILEGAVRTDATLAYTGDKRFICSASGNALLMYQVRGSSWLVMGDPVGPREDWRELLWAIRGRADAAQGRLLLYQISAAALEIALELGFQLVKYGEEALVDLTDFSLEGPRMRGLRHAQRRAAREGATFELIPASSVERILPQLAAISDAWLADKNQQEKGFSLGRFDPDYLTRFDCAVVRHEGRIVAFANVLATFGRQELSVDLMRHLDTMPPGTMDFLFASLMQWGRENGYQRFALGLAPLSGIEARRLSPRWAKIAAVLFNHGERLYGFKGLRAYKDKFDPYWEPRYIAGPQGLGLLQALIDLNRLISNPPSGAIGRRVRKLHPGSATRPETFGPRPSLEPKPLLVAQSRGGAV
ncbi:MAG TPA: bifunctional lysylphosphatidylglycerol flippase/synthetase MprF [Novosphingobium sp.]